MIRLDLLGDLVLSMPAAALVQQRYPDASVDFLTLPYTAPLLRHFGFIRRTLTLDVNQLRPSGAWHDPAIWRDAAEVLSEVRAARYDLVVGLCGAWASAIAAISGAPLTVGYAGESLRDAYTLAVPGARYDRTGHEAEWCLRLANVAGERRLSATGGRFSPAEFGFHGLAGLRPDPAARARIDRLLTAHDVCPDQPLAVVHPGALNGAAKRWPERHLAGLCDRLAARGIILVLTGSKSEAPLAAKVLATTTSSCSRPRLVNLTGQTDLPELVALLDRCRVVVSGDSAPMHLAVALGVPTVALHGPTDPNISGPWGGNATVLRLDLPCMPCYDATDPAECPLGHHRCLRDLPVAAVESAVLATFRKGRV